MKTIHTELGNITDIVYRIAMSHPEVSLKLFHNEKKLLHTSGNGDVRQVLCIDLQYSSCEEACSN